MSKEKREKIYIMSIKPKYAKAIYEGKKNWEFRKVPPPIGERIYIYESEPVSAVTGIVIFSLKIEGLFASVYTAIAGCKQYCSNKPGISVKELEEYAGGKTVSALRVIDAVKFDRPVPLKFKPPMNWGRYFLRPDDEKGGEK